MMPSLGPDEARLMDAYWRAANRLIRKHDINATVLLSQSCTSTATRSPARLSIETR